MNPEPTIRAAALLDFLALLESWSGEIDSTIYGPQHVEGRLAALHQVRVYVTALIEPLGCYDGGSDVAYQRHHDMACAFTDDECRRLAAA